LGTIRIKNNIFFVTNNGSATTCLSFQNTSNGPTELDYNFYYNSYSTNYILGVTTTGNSYYSLAQMQALGYETHGMVANPGFLNFSYGFDSSLNNFHLASNAPAIGAGTNFSAIFTTDLDGNPRPATGPWDIGAYEYIVPPVFQRIQQTGGHIAFTWNAIVSSNYQFQTTTNLNGGNWQNCESPITATNSIMSWSNTISPDPQRFYRLLVE
jgi:hypothetical protein